MPDQGIIEMNVRLPFQKLLECQNTVSLLQQLWVRVLQERIVRQHARGRFTHNCEVTRFLRQVMMNAVLKVTGDESQVAPLLQWQPAQLSDKKSRRGAIQVSDLRFPIIRCDRFPESDSRRLGDVHE